jgi:hypothetical protein
VRADPICPAHLMMDKAMTDIPSTQFETGKQRVKRLRVIQEVNEEFFDAWVKEVFLLLLKQTKWTKYKKHASWRHDIEEG